jgi:hypothetical protein
MGIYDTWIDTTHENANDPQECEQLIQGLTPKQVRDVYTKVGSKLADKYLKETVKFYVQHNAKSSGTKDVANVTPEQIATVKQLYGSAPSDVTGQVSIDAPLDAEQILRRNTISGLTGTKQKREKSQKSVMAGLSATDVTCSSFLMCDIVADQVGQIAKILKIVKTSTKGEKKTRKYEWGHRIGHSVSQLDNKPDHVQLGTPKKPTYKVTAQVPDNLGVLSAECNTQMMRYRFRSPFYQCLIVYCQIRIRNQRLGRDGA